ncbi:MAG: hypothetical protein KAY11_10335 [Ilumatobacteraceae bacterium]|nr:hypothetical protein [Acidimicrobiaceae bacterium]MBP8209952.1 hypothetical protein [Ilumatobacteraceae bacterium]MBP9053035.1 hypothetical protein [Ilumatobacteraceae bacterium]HRC08939.1 hypothetical protein [Miltoncostaeales bacterium]
MIQYAQARGVPQPKLAALVSGFWIVIGALSVALGVWGDVGALMLVAFLVPDLDVSSRLINQRSGSLTEAP